LAACDTDPFVRWEACQTIARNTLLACADAIKAGHPLDIGEDLGRALEGALRDAKSDPAFAALMLRLPDVGELMQLKADCDPEDLHSARQFVRRVLADQLDAPLNATFAAYDPAQPFSPSAQAAGERALAGAALELLCAAGDDRAALRAENFFYASRNMTDMIAALSGLSEIGGPRFEAVLTRFKHQFHDNALVMDKWFRIQAMASSEDGIERFLALRADPAFTLLNPNRVRALGGAFAMGNYKSFHRRDGVGYQVMIALIKDVDLVNGAVGARLATTFEACARVDARRRAHAKAAIKTLLASNALSANSREILGKIIEAL
jgi:aminopeptidase N